MTRQERKRKVEGRAWGYGRQLSSCRRRSCSRGFLHSVAAVWGAFLILRWGSEGVGGWVGAGVGGKVGRTGP